MSYPFREGLARTFRFSGLSAALFLNSSRMMISLVSPQEEKEETARHLEFLKPTGAPRRLPIPRRSDE